MRVAIIASNAGSLVNFRGPLIEALVADGHEVIAIAPFDQRVASKLQGLRVKFVGVGLERTGMNPLRDLQYRRALKQVLAAERVEGVLAYTIKPIVHGLPAAKRAGVAQRYALITGLGAAFFTEGLKGALLRTIAALMYRRALSLASAVIVQNRDIGVFMQRHRIVSPDTTVAVVPGSGIDLRRFTASDVSPGPPVFLMLARLLKDKGVREYVEAARFVKSRRPEARFVIAGAADSNPAAVSPRQLAEWKNEGIVEFHPEVEDVRPLLAASYACVLPSYHEGLPRSLLEAMATSRPIITTDVIGCRELVDHPGAADESCLRVGTNGILVPVRDAQALAAAMLQLLDDSQLTRRMGREGRALAEQRYEAGFVSCEMLRAMSLGAPRLGK